MDTFQHQVFSVAAAANHLSVSRGFLYKLAAQKRLRITKIGRRSVVTGRELARFIADAERAG